MFSSAVFVRSLAAIFFIILASSLTHAQSSGLALYNKLKAFELGGDTVTVSDLTIKRDRVVMTFNGTFHLAAPIDGKITGAIFVGNGTMKAEVPPSDFERANLRRLIKADSVTTDFSTATLRFTDDTAALIGSQIQKGQAPPQAVKLAGEINDRLLRATGANLASRLMMSVVNREDRGFFYAYFDGGKIDDLEYIFDPHYRLPTLYFTINGGERGLLYREGMYGPEVLMAFYGEDDYAKGVAAYSDAHDQVDVEHHDMTVDLRSPKDKLSIRTRMRMLPLSNDLTAISFSIGESLSAEDRQKKQMRVQAVRLGGATIEHVQEEREGGFTVFLPKPAAKGQSLELEIDAEGDFLRQGEGINGTSYQRSNQAWYPRHGYLDRSTYSLTYLHPKNLKVASIGVRTAETDFPEDKNVRQTKYSMSHPVALITFALGPWQRHSETVKFENSDKAIPLEFNSISGAVAAIKEDFILAELNNSVRYFNALFGAYPYDSYSATFHPYGFGQGFPSMLMIPPTDRSSKYTFAFISHETAHQWWGNIVSWRSYRDQWLSEGFAEYSGLMYTSLRDGKGSGRELLDEMRSSLKQPPRTITGVGTGRLNDVGPLVLGHRVSTTKTIGAYQALIYSKGALVLRMVHYLLSDPATGDDKAFKAMMRDFTDRYRNKSASTDDFRQVAGEYFARSPIGQKYQMKNLDWFFRQWVQGTEMPSYRVEYSFTNNPDGSVMIAGNVFQEGVDDKWFMPVPISFGFGGDAVANGSIAAFGPKTAFQIKLPRKPSKVEIDPQKWIITDKVDVKQQ